MRHPVNHHYKNAERSSRVLFTLLLLLTAAVTQAQNLSNKGKEFWVGYGHHQFMEPGGDNSQQMILYLSAETASNVTVRIEGTAWVRTYAIPANTVIATEFIPKSGINDARLYSVPPSFGGTGGEGVFTSKGIHITSDVPIVAYAHIYGSASSGATMLMPVDTWGYSYISVNSQQNYSDDCFSWMYVVANKDNTVVEITPSVLTRNGRAPGVPFTATLQRGQIYQLVGASLGGGAGRELTGTKVRSIGNTSNECYPIGVFSGSSRTAISCTGGGGSGDNNMQQIFPFQAWGKRYLTAPTSNGGSASSFMTNIYKVVVKDPTTVVKRNGAVLTGLTANSYYQFNSNTADYIESDKPILVAQFMSSSGGCPNTGGDGDPEMIYLSPIEQAIKRVGFYRNNRESINTNYLTLIIPDSGRNSLKIDGASVWNHIYNHPNLAGYSVIVKRWSSTQAQCIVTSDSSFTAITYGLGSVESYGYNAGTLINNLNAVGSIHNTLDTSRTSNDYTCTRTPVQLSVLMAYQPTKMVWKLSALGASVTPNADVTVNSPVSVGTVIIKGVPYYKYTLPQTYTFNTTGTFEVPILSTHPSIDNCNNTEQVSFSVVVVAKPTALFSYTHTGCTKDTVYFKGDTSGKGFSVERWKWDFATAPLKDSGKTVKHVFPVGNHNIKLTAITKEGCVGDTTFSVPVVAVPVANFTTSAATLCEGGNVNVTDNSTFGGTAPIKTWEWDFGNDTTITVSTNAPQTGRYKDYRTYTIKHVVKVSDLCISDTVSRTVSVYAKPRLSVAYPGDCLPTNGLVQFTGNSTVPDGQTLSNYSWNFGDAGATPTNPNTSTLKDPTHTYSTFGTYNISYSVTTDKGCTKDTIIKAVFKLKPALNFPDLVGVCVNAKAPVSLAKGTVTNRVVGKGYYRGPGIDSAGNFNPATAGVATHTIWFVFKTDDGCADSISRTITVYPKPTGAFTLSPDVCLGAVANVTDQSTITSGNIASWKWDFGNGTAPVYTNNNPFNINYTAVKNYDVKLVAVSDLGCTSDTVKHVVIVHPLPVSDFTMPASICMPAGKADFTNQSKVADNSALTYAWNFGDGTAASTVKDPSHVYPNKGPFTVRLQTTSAYGCKHDTSKLLNSFLDKPLASFSVSPAELCQGADNSFTDNSTAPNSTVRTWKWDFGDGTTSSDRNPVKRYKDPKEYQISLVVVNAAGCESDTFRSKVVVHLQPVIDAGRSFTVPFGTKIQFAATANDPDRLTFRWTPATGLSDATILRPSLQANRDEVYTLTATGAGNCTATDDVRVKVLKPVNVPNAFSPNGDRINDVWVITNLADYPGSTVEVYNRYGQRVFRSNGYTTPWDGSYNGTRLPVATYYYVIRLNNGFEPLTGNITILR